MELSLNEVPMLVLSRVEGPVLSRACPESLDSARDKLCRRVEGLIDVN
ncbi:MAG: hypothetical protein GTN71_00285 [Anaerolineae bacterium]|nr:hypothetical protein [Anaerolineae bacterium]